MSTLSKRETVRMFNCDQYEGRVSQKIYRENSVDEPAWGCIGRCPIIDCEHNLHPADEELRYNLYGRTNVW